MKRFLRPSGFVLELAIVIVLAGCACPCSKAGKAVSATPTAITANGEPAARVGGEIISSEELDRASQEGLKRLAGEIYDIKSQQLDQMVGERLLALEAKSQGISVGELQKRIQTGTRQAYFESLKKKYGVTTHLEPPRVNISLKDTPIRGAKNASVTVVEFSDFECPFCSRIQPVMKQLRSNYKDRVNFAFKHFPLPFHRRAKKVHLAALCAGEQGRFWEFRDMIFDHPGKIDPADLNGYAERLGLNMPDFEKCVSDERYASKIESDFQEGVEIGVQGTPSFFVNGRPLSGAQSYSTFSTVIDEELKKSDKS